jgi:hypothetical protein
MTHTGGCHCGAVRYSVTGEPQHVVLCHCSDCRKSAGAPMVAWAAFSEGELTLTQGAIKIIQFIGHGAAQFLRRVRHGAILSQRSLSARHRRYPVSHA